MLQPAVRRARVPGRAHRAQARGRRPFVDGTIPTTLDKKLAPEGVHVFSMFTQWVPDDWNEEPHRDELDAVRASGSSTGTRSSRRTSRDADHRLSGDRPLRHGAGPRPDRREHLPRRAQRGPAVPHATGARLRRLPHAGARPVPRLVRHARRRRRERHPGLAGVPPGQEGQGRRPRSSGRAPPPPSPRHGPASSRCWRPGPSPSWAPASRRARWAAR